MEIVNGYRCRDCTDVAYAKKNIDPAHPKEGPQPTSQASERRVFSQSVQFGGALAEFNNHGLDDLRPDARAPTQRLNLFV
jgi:hypothetical protein